MKRLFTEKEVREIIGKNEELGNTTKEAEDIKKVCESANRLAMGIMDYARNQLRQEQLAILEKMRGEIKS